MLLLGGIYTGVRIIPEVAASVKPERPGRASRREAELCPPGLWLGAPHQWWDYVSCFLGAKGQGMQTAPVLEGLEHRIKLHTFPAVFLLVRPGRVCAMSSLRDSVHPKSRLCVHARPEGPAFPSLQGSSIPGPSVQTSPEHGPLS